MAKERFRYDRSSKWLIDHQGGAILKVGGMRDMEAWRAVPSEVVQPRQLPDGLLEVRRASSPSWQPVVVEIEADPDSQTPADLVDDLMLVYLNRRVLPDVLVLVLAPKGNVTLSDKLTLHSPGGLSELSGRWRTVPLWTLSAADLLATGDPGVMPWVTLAHIDGPPEPVLDECRRVIEERARPDEKANLLAVCQVLGGLRYNAAMLRSLFGRREGMIESPVTTEWQAEGMQMAILGLLKDRFGPVPADLKATLAPLIDLDRLVALNSFAARCPDLDAFRRELASGAKDAAASGPGQGPSA
jgi:hypothetical protein